MNYSSKLKGPSDEVKLSMLSKDIQKIMFSTTDRNFHPCKKEIGDSFLKFISLCNLHFMHLIKILLTIAVYVHSQILLKLLSGILKFSSLDR